MTLLTFKSPNGKFAVGRQRRVAGISAINELAAQIKATQGVAEIKRAAVKPRVEWSPK